MHDEAAWIWWTVPSYDGIQAIMLATLATEKQIQKFQRDYEDIQDWSRPVGVYWDGSEMSDKEIAEWQRQPVEMS